MTEEQWVEVWRGADHAELLTIKSLFDAHGIRYVEQSSGRRWSSLEGTRICVNAQDREVAKTLLNPKLHPTEPHSAESRRIRSVMITGLIVLLFALYLIGLFGRTLRLQ